MNHCDRDGCTALMLSSGTGSEEDAEGNCVDYLLKVIGEKCTYTFCRIIAQINKGALVKRRI